jgi:hypothetical protein
MAHATLHKEEASRGFCVAASVNDGSRHSFGRPRPTDVTGCNLLLRKPAHESNNERKRSKK